MSFLPLRALSTAALRIALFCVSPVVVENSGGTVILIYSAWLSFALLILIISLSFASIVCSVPIATSTSLRISHSSFPQSLNLLTNSCGVTFVSIFPFLLRISDISSRLLSKFASSNLRSGFPSHFAQRARFFLMGSDFISVEVKSAFANEPETQSAFTISPPTSVMV